MRNVTAVTEVRTVDTVSFTLTEGETFGFIKHVGPKGSGFLFGRIKISALKSKPGFYSLRSLGADGTGRTVHVPAGSKVVLNGDTYTVAALFSSLQVTVALRRLLVG